MAGRLIRSERTAPFIGRSFCVALRPQPIDSTAASKPFVYFRLALKALDVPIFGSGIVGFDLPLALCDTVEFECDPRFAHEPIMPILGTDARRPEQVHRLAIAAVPWEGAHWEVDPMSAENEKIFAEFDALDAGQVRANLASGVYLGARASLARAWLERRNEASQAEQLSLARAAAAEARFANTRAHSANKIAIAALVVATISMITAIIFGVIGIFQK
jgi:hypothetical protein